MAIFNSYVKLPEGSCRTIYYIWICTSEYTWIFERTHIQLFICMFPNQWISRYVWHINVYIYISPYCVYVSCDTCTNICIHCPFTCYMIIYLLSLLIYNITARPLVLPGDLETFPASWSRSWWWWWWWCKCGPAGDHGSDEKIGDDEDAARRVMMVMMMMQVRPGGWSW